MVVSCLRLEVRSSWSKASASTRNGSPSEPVISRDGTAHSGRYPHAVALRRILLGTLVLIAAACAPNIPAPANLVLADPAPDAVIGALPETLQLNFSDPLLAGASSATVIDPTGQVVPAAVDVAPDDPTALVVRITQPGGAGRFTVQWTTVSASARSPADGEFSFTVEPGAPQQPRLSVLPAATDVDQPLVVSGTGFDPQAAITLTVGDNSEPMGTAQSDASGAFDQTVTVPHDVPFGQQPVWARDDSGAKAGAEVGVRWGGWPPLIIYTQAAPGPDHGQVTLTVVGINRSDYVLDGVRIHLELPPGAALVTATAGAEVQDGELIWDQGILGRTSLVPRSAVLSVGGPVVGRSSIDFRHRRAPGCIGDQCLPAFVDQTNSESGQVVPAP